MPFRPFRRMHLGMRRCLAAARGYKLYALAVLFALPDVLAALGGFDWSSVLPAGYEGYGARIAGILLLARLVLTPIGKAVQDAGRGVGGPGAPR